jgi:hypothetical protein
MTAGEDAALLRFYSRAKTFLPTGKSKGWFRVCESAVAMRVGLK